VVYWPELCRIHPYYYFYYARGLTSAPPSLMPDCAGPGLLPGQKLTGPDLVSREISLMQAQELRLCHVPEFRALRVGDVFLDPGRDVRGGGFSVHGTAHHLGHHLAQRSLVLEPERIGLAQRLPHRGVSSGGAFIRPDEYIPQQINLVHLINGQNRLGVERPRHVDERQRREIALDEWNVRGQARHTLVHVIEGLQVWQLNHRKQRLFERIVDCRGHGEQLIEAIVD